MMNKRGTKAVGIIVVILTSLILYSLTFARYIFLEDSAEFVVASYTLSIPHPSGYPLFIMLGKLFSWLPFFSDVASRVNFLAVIFAVLAAVFLFLSLLRLYQMFFLALALTLVFIMAPMVWLQASYAEVYSFNSFFLTLLLWLYLIWRRRKDNKIMYLLVFVYGLSLTNHFLMLVLAPILAIWFFKNFDIKKNFGLYLNSFFIFLLGLSPYLYIPLRSLGKPVFSWYGGNLGKLLTYNIARGHTVSQSTIYYLGDVWNFLLTNLGVINAILVFIGIFVMFYYKFYLRYFLVAAIFLFSYGLLIVLSGGQVYSDLASWFYQQLYVPLIIISLIIIGYLLFKLITADKSPIKYGVLIFIVLLVPLYNLGNTWLANDKSDYVFLENYTARMLSLLPSHSILYIYQPNLMMDPIVFGLAYQRYVKNLRPDVKIYSLSPVFSLPDDFPRSDLQNANLQLVLTNYLSSTTKEGMPQCTTFPRSGAMSNGFVYCSNLSTDSGWPVNAFYRADNLMHPANLNNVFGRSLMAKWYYDMAIYAFQKGSFRLGQFFIVKALVYDAIPFSRYYRTITNLRNEIIKSS